MLKIWHLFQCDLVDWDWRVEKKNKFAKKLGASMRDPNFSTIIYYAHGKFM